MIKSRKYFLAVTVALCITLLWSCTQERQPCLTPKRANMKIRCVLPAADNKVTDTPLPAAVLVPLTGATTLTATLYTKQSSFTLYLSPVADTCMWMIASDSTAGSKYDTITFRYERKLEFLSNACGYTYFYELKSTSTTHNNIDSISIINATVNNNASTNNLQVYYHR